MRASGTEQVVTHKREVDEPDLSGEDTSPIRRYLPRIILWAVVACVLVTAIVNLPARWSSVGESLAMLRLWGDPEEQHRAQAVDLPHPHDLLRAVDAVVPRDATLLLVTSGEDAGRYEYITFHRALYLLAPRAVWWVSPASPDGSWKSRWWVSRPLTAEAIGEVAREKGAQYVLAVGLDEELSLGRKVGEWPEGYLLSLEEGGRGVGAGGYAQYAGAWWPLQMLAAVAVMLGVGWVVIRVAARLGLKVGWLEGAALAWALGAGVATVLMMWLSWLGLSLEWQIGIITLIVVGIGVVEFVAWRQKRKSVEWDMSRVAAEGVESGGGVTEGLPVKAGHYFVRVLLAVLLGLQFFLVGIEAVGRPLRVWDSWANWAIKARIIFLDGYISPAVYGDASRAVTQLDYPLMMPLAEAWLFGWLGAPDDRLVGVAHLLFLGSLVALVYCAVRAAGGGVTSALAVALAAACIANVAGMASIVFAEMPLIVFAVIAGIYLNGWMRGGSMGALLVACVGAGLLAWTKREGVVLLVCLCVGVLLLNVGKRRAWVAVGGMLAGALALAGPWWVFVAREGIANPAFGPVTLEALDANSGRWPKIWEVWWASLTGPGLGYVWPLVAVAGTVLLVVGRGREAWRGAFLPVSALLFSFAMGFSFFFSVFVPYEDHLISSIDRLLAEVVVLPLLWVVFMVWENRPAREPAGYVSEARLRGLIGRRFGKRLESG